MADERAVTRYTTPAIIAHWLVALLIVGNLALGLLAEKLPEADIRFAIDSHKSIGVTVLGLVILRLLWRLGHRPPPFSGSMKPWERALAHLAHFGLYFMMFAMPLTGWAHDSAWKAAPEIPMRWFNLFEFPRIGFIMHLPDEQKEYFHGLLGTVHMVGGYLLIALLLLHILGALKHEFIDGQVEFGRMWLR